MQKSAARAGADKTETFGQPARGAAQEWTQALGRADRAGRQSLD